MQIAITSESATEKFAEEEIKRRAAEIRDLRKSIWAGNLEVLHRIDQVHTLVLHLTKNDAGTRRRGRDGHDGSTGPVHCRGLDPHRPVHRRACAHSTSGREMEEDEERCNDSDKENTVNGGDGEGESARWWMN